MDGRNILVLQQENPYTHRDMWAERVEQLAQIRLANLGVSADGDHDEKMARLPNVFFHDVPTEIVLPRHPKADSGQALILHPPPAERHPLDLAVYTLQLATLL